METLFRQTGIYAPHGQSGAIMEKGITEAGCMMKKSGQIDKILSEMLIYVVLET